MRVVGKCLTNWFPIMPTISRSCTLACSENQSKGEVSLDIDVLSCLFETSRALVCSHVLVVCSFHSQNNGSSMVGDVFLPYA